VTLGAHICKYRLEDPPSGARPDRPACRRGNWLCRGAVGLEAVAPGFHLIAKDDKENQRLQFPLSGALYEYCCLRREIRAAPRAHAYRGKELLRGGPTLTLRTDEGVASGPQSEGTEEVGPRSR
jgi:hypothetical protein